MANDLSHELESFRQFVSDRLEDRPDMLSLEDALDLWRVENPSPEEFDDTVIALQEALDDLDRGVAGVPLAQVERELRARHNLPPKP